MKTKLLFLSFAVVLFSCSKDDDPMPTSDGLVGTWTMTSLTYNGTTTTTASGMTINADFTGRGKDMDYITTFQVNPNTVVSEGSYTIELTTTILGQTTTDDYEFEEALSDGTWELNGKTLTITNGSDSQQGIITKQTDTTLEVKVDLNMTENGPGYSITQEVHAVYTFSK
jgi:hypothetical protein